MPYNPFVNEALMGWLVFIMGTFFVTLLCAWRWTAFKRLEKTETFRWETAGHILRWVVFLGMVWTTAFLQVDGGVCRHNVALLQEELSRTKTRQDVHAIMNRYGSKWPDRSSSEAVEFGALGFSLMMWDIVHVTYRPDHTVENYRIGS